MKSIFIILLFICATTLAYSQTVSIDSLYQYEGKKVTVCTKVESIYVSKKSKKTTFINFGKPYPNEKLIVVVFEKDLVHFNYDIPIHLKNKIVCITGIVKMYNGKPEIIANKEEQIVIQ